MPGISLHSSMSTENTNMHIFKRSPSWVMNWMIIYQLTNWFPSVDINDESRSQVTTQNLILSWKNRHKGALFTSVLSTGSWDKHETNRKINICINHLNILVCAVKLTGSRSRTGLAGLIPSFSHIVGAAAHLLGHVERQLVFTRVVEVAVAHAFSHVCVTVLKINYLFFICHMLRHVYNQEFIEVSVSPMQLFPPLTCMYSGGHTQV